MSEHTPGPWGLNNDYIGSMEGEIAQVISENVGILENEANARLIAAAPELLEAVKKAHTYMENWGAPYSELKDLERVINKAEGDTE